MTAPEGLSISSPNEDHWCTHLLLILRLEGGGNRALQAPNRGDDRAQDESPLAAVLLGSTTFVPLHTDVQNRLVERPESPAPSRIVGPIQRFSRRVRSFALNWSVAKAWRLHTLVLSSGL